MAEQLSTEASWPKRLMSLYEEGADDVEVSAALKMSQAQFDAEYANNELFKELVDVGRLISAAWWRGVARKNIFNKNLNTQAWMFVMKNRFGWAEKADTTINGNVPAEQLSLEETRSLVLAKMPGILKRLGVEMKEADVIDLSEKKDGRK